MDKITSVKNPAVGRLRALTDAGGRRAAGALLVEGVKLSGEALKAGLTFKLALMSRAFIEKHSELAEEIIGACPEVYEAADHVIGAVSGVVTPQGVCAACSIPPPLDASRADRLVVLDEVQDPGNVGTIWRTADAAGFDGIVLSAGCADPFSMKVQRAAMGSGLRLPALAADDLCAELERLRLSGFKVIASALDGADFFARMPVHGRVALVVGNESRGVSDAVMRMSDERLSLPMRGGAESLNAAVAAGIMMYLIDKN